MRRRRTGFSREEQRLARAQSLLRVASGRRARRPRTRARISFGAHRTRRTHRVAGPYAAVASSGSPASSMTKADLAPRRRCCANDHA